MSQIIVRVLSRIIAEEDRIEPDPEIDLKSLRPCRIKSIEKARYRAENKPWWHLFTSRKIVFKRMKAAEIQWESLCQKTLTNLSAFEDILDFTKKCPPDGMARRVCFTFIASLDLPLEIIQEAAILSGFSNPALNKRWGELRSNEIPDLINREKHRIGKIIIDSLDDPKLTSEIYSDRAVE